MCIREGDIIRKFDQVVAGSILIDGIDRIRKGDGAIGYRSCISNLKNLRILGVGGIIFRIDLLHAYRVRTNTPPPYFLRMQMRGTGRTSC